MASEELEQLPPADMNPYELERLKLIARNRARLIALGIPSAVKELSALIPAPRATSHRSKKPKVHKEPQEPTRRSARLQPGSSVGSSQLPPSVEPGSELALFMIDGECPRCGRVSTRGHREHLSRCHGPVVLSEEEIKAQAEEMKRRDKDKLRALELGGLVDLTEEQALFIVVGSTGNHYKIKFSDGEKKRSCTCLDHRFRRHDCKHIRLVLQQLGLDKDEEKEKWREAVMRMFQQSSSAAPSPRMAAQENSGGVKGEDRGAKEVHTEVKEEDTALVKSEDSDQDNLPLAELKVANRQLRRRSQRKGKRKLTERGVSTLEVIKEEAEEQQEEEEEEEKAKTTPTLVAEQALDAKQEECPLPGGKTLPSGRKVPKPEGGGFVDRATKLARTFM